MARTVVKRFPIGVTNSVRTTYVEGGGTVDVNASNDFIALFGLTVNPNSNWTLALLLFPRHDGLLYNQTIYAQQNGTGTGRGWISSPLVGQFFSCALGGVTRNSTQKPVLNQWQWVVFSNSYSSGSGTNTLTMYHMMLGGSSVSQIGQFSGITYENCDGAHRIGATKDDAGTGTGTRCYDGNIGDFKFYTTAFTVEQIFALCASNDYPITNLACHLPMREPSGTILSDMSGNVKNGTLMNGAAIDTGTSPWSIRTVVSRTAVGLRTVA